MSVIPLRTEETQQELEVGFDDFWNMYPRRVAKKDARLAWARIETRLHTEILAALFEWRRIWMDRNELQFVPYPATWLRGERWEDEYPQGHRPYKDQPAQKSVQPEKEEPRKKMPDHVRDALLKFRNHG